MASAAARSNTSGSPPPAVGSLGMASAPQTATPSHNAEANDTPSTSPRHNGKGNGSDTSSPSAIPPFRQNGHKSCDACKTRKVKCPNVDYPNPCGNCVRRKEACHFGTKKVPRRNVTKHLRFTQPCTPQDGPAPGSMLCYVDAPGTDGSSHHDDPARHAGDLIPSLYVDHLLAQAQSQTRGNEPPFVKGNGIFGGSYSLTFFSESRLLSLSNRLRNNKVNELVRRINGIVSGRLRRGEQPAGDVGSNRSTSTSTSTGSLGGHGGHGGHGGLGGLGGIGSTSSGPTLSIASVMDDSSPMPVDPQFAAACISCYFERVHPMYPFLDRAAFEAQALPVPGNGDNGEKALARSLARSKAWSALYYTVLAIGCVYSEDGGPGSAGVNTAAARELFPGNTAGVPGTAAPSPSGSFEPGKGTAWRLFSMALASFSDLLILPDSLLTLQALTAMVIYGLGVSCLSIEHVILSEASRRAQSLASNFGTSTSASSASSPAFQRTFWVLYGLEKVMSFHFGRSSTFVDSDIACPFPTDLDDGYSSSDDGSEYACAATSSWFLLLVRHARLLSRTYSSLFSVGTARVTAASSLATIHRLCDEVEAWRLAIPETRGLRPERNCWHGGSAHSASGSGSGSGAGSSTGSNKNSMALRSANPTERNIALALRYLYHGLIVILARAKLHHLCLLQSDMAHAVPVPASWTMAAARDQETEARRGLMVSARGILELTPIIDVEPYMPLWILAVIPLTALFVLFDLVVDHPGDVSVSAQSAESAKTGARTISTDTALNLALLDMGAGYFSRIEYASSSSLPGSLISEFAHIARDYVNDYQRGDRPTQPPLPPPPHAHCGRSESPDADCTDVVHGLPMLQSTPHMLSDQQPLPPPPPPAILAQQQATATALPTRQALPASADQQQMNLMAASSLSAWAPSSVPGPGTGPGAAATSASGDSLALVGGANVGGFTDVTDGLGYGFGANPYQPGNADFSGTDVMGLFTSNHYFLSEMDGILYNGL